MYIRTYGMVSKKQKKLILVGILKATEEKKGAGSVIQWYGSAHPHHNVTDLEHCFPGQKLVEIRHVGPGVSFLIMVSFCVS